MRAVVAVLVTLAGCSHLPGSCDYPAPNGQCCDGIECPSGLQPVQATVVDTSSQQPIAVMPNFTSPDHVGPLETSCISFPASPCPSWMIETTSQLGAGTHDITATVTGYQPATFTVAIPAMTGCCGNSNPVMVTVPLTP